MLSIPEIGLAEVQATYSGPEVDLWQLLMGQQIHVGGLRSSMELAQLAGIGGGGQGVDLCCCQGAGMRFLVRFRAVASMCGVDATEAMLDRARRAALEEGVADRMRFLLADACDSGLPDAAADFVWGEDAWCYVVDKERLVAEAVRLVRPGGVVAFTDWVAGARPMSDAETERLLRFMKFSNLQSLAGYRALLAERGCRIIAAEDTGRLGRCFDLYLRMVDQQLAFDALRILGFDQQAFAAVAAEMEFLQQLAHAGKLIQGRFVAVRN